MSEAEKLRPSRLAEAIAEDLKLIDDMPNYQMLMGRTGASSGSGANLQDVGGAFSQRKVAWCTKYLEEFGDDPGLAAAYTAKRAKELSAANTLFTPQAMQSAYDRAEAGLVALNRKLHGRGAHWLYQDSITLADLFWGIELSRMKNVGVSHLWESDRLPDVERFSASTEQVSALRTAVIDWPGAMF